MERPGELALRSGIDALMRPSRESLQSTAFGELVTLVDQLRRAYPHQDLADSLEILTRGFEILASRHGLSRVREGLEILLVEPGRRFFPLVGELSEVLENMKTNEREQARRDNPFRPCGQCEDGWLAENRDGTPHDPRRGGPRYMRECACLRDWKRRVRDAAGADASEPAMSRSVRSPYREAADSVR